MAYVIFWGERLDKEEDRSKVKAVAGNTGARLDFSRFCLASHTHPKCPPCRSTLLSPHLCLNWVCPTITLTALPEQPHRTSLLQTPSASVFALQTERAHSPPRHPPGVSPTPGIKENVLSLITPLLPACRNYLLILSPLDFLTCPLLKTLCWHAPGRALHYPPAPNQNVISSRKPLLTPACRWASRASCFTITALPSLYRNHLFRLHDLWVRLKKIQEGKACACSSRADVRAGEVAFLAVIKWHGLPDPQQPMAETDNSIKAGPPKRYRWSSLGCFILTLKTPRTE